MKCYAAVFLLLFSFSSFAQSVVSSSSNPEIRTPVPPAAPRINGPRIYGARPGRAFFYHLPVSGLRPISGNINASAKFSNMKLLSDYVHSRGLKIGLYSSLGPMTFANAAGSWLHEDQNAATYASWGIDYLKYDWCSHGSIASLAWEERYAKLLPDQAAELCSLAAEQAVIAMARYHRDTSQLPQSTDIKQFEAEEASLSGTQITTGMQAIDQRLAILHDEAQKIDPSAATIDSDIDKAAYAKMRTSG